MMKKITHLGRFWLYLIRAAESGGMDFAAFERSFGNSFGYVRKQCMQKQPTQEFFDGCCHYLGLHPADLRIWLNNPTAYQAQYCDNDVMLSAYEVSQIIEKDPLT